MQGALEGGGYATVGHKSGRIAAIRLHMKQGFGIYVGNAHLLPVVVDEAAAKPAGGAAPLAQAVAVGGQAAYLCLVQAEAVGDGF